MTEATVNVKLITLTCIWAPLKIVLSGTGKKLSHKQKRHVNAFATIQDRILCILLRFVLFVANVDLAVASVKVAGYRNNIQLTANVKFNFTFDIEHQKVSDRPENRLEDS